MLGNTGFVGLGIIPNLLNAGDMSWAIFFSVTQNLIGTYRHWRFDCQLLWTVRSA